MQKARLIQTHTM